MGIRQVIESKKDAIYGEGSTTEEIARAEEALNLKFADDYREYLMDFSVVMYGGHELTGLSKTDRVNVVSVTKDHEFKRPTDDSYVIEETGVDGILIWQNSEGEVFQNNRKICSNLSEYIESY